MIKGDTQYKARYNVTNDTTEIENIFWYDGSFYAFEGELTLASEMQTWQSSFISVKHDDQLRDKYTMYALVHIDNDGIPEMICKGENRSAVLWHDQAKDETYAVEFTGRQKFLPAPLTVALTRKAILVAGALFGNFT